MSHDVNIIVYHTFYNLV